MSHFRDWNLVQLENEDFWIPGDCARSLSLSCLLLQKPAHSELITSLSSFYVPIKLWLLIALCDHADQLLTGQMNTGNPPHVRLDCPAQAGGATLVNHVPNLWKGVDKWEGGGVRVPCLLEIVWSNGSRSPIMYTLKWPNTFFTWGFYF